ncbi:MAG: hypothetical protein ACK4RZ_09075 [Paracoccaceae bacterium]
MAYGIMPVDNCPVNMQIDMIGVGRSALPLSLSLSLCLSYDAAHLLRGILS